MEDSEIHFCSECQNMTFLYLDQEKKLIHYCKACEDRAFLMEKTIVSIQLNIKYDKSEYINHNPYITQDVTLPIIEGNINIKCTNPECICNTSDKESSIKYIKYDENDAKNIFIFVIIVSKIEK